MSAAFAENGSILLDAGDVGGDYQASASISRQFSRANDDGTYTTVEVFAFVTSEFRGKDRPKASRFWDYSVMTFVTTHTDPNDVGGSELDSDVLYENNDGMVSPANKRAAFAQARRHVESLAPADFEEVGE